MIDLSRRLFLKLAGAGVAGAGAAVLGAKIPKAEAQLPEVPIPSDSEEELDFDTEYAYSDVSKAVRIFKHHGKVAVDVTKPTRVLSLHRFMAEELDNTSSGDDILDITANNFSWRHTDYIFSFEDKYYTVSPRSFRNLRDGAVIYGKHRFFTIERVGFKQGPIRVNGMPFIDRQLLHCKKIHHFTHKPFINKPWQKMEYRMIAKGEEYNAYKYIIPV